MRRRTGFFILCVISILLVALTYPLALFNIFPPSDAFNYFKHNPNFSIFSLTIFPVAAGLFFVVLRDFRRQIPTAWVIWLMVGGVPIITTVILPDALEKGPPIQPTHFHLDAAQREQMVALETRIRRSYWADTPSTQEKVQERYVSEASRILQVPENAVWRFRDFNDFRQRASPVALADLMISVVGAAVVVVIFWFLAFLHLSNQEVGDRKRDAIAWVYMLFLLWLPLRIYALWHQGFYSLSNTGEVLHLTVVVGYLGLVYIAAFYAKGAMAKAISILHGVTAGVVAAIMFVKPDLLLHFVGETARSVSLGFLFALEIVLITFLISVAWPFLNDQDTVG